MADQLKTYITSCDACQCNKSSTLAKPGLLHPIPVPSANWEQVSMDFIVQLPWTKNGKDAIVVFVDYLSKQAHFVSTTTTAIAPDIATLLFDNIFHYHGLPKIIVSDWDPKFTSHFWQALFKTLGTQIAMSTAFHPQTDGQTE